MMNWQGVRGIADGPIDVLSWYFLGGNWEDYENLNGQACIQADIQTKQLLGTSLYCLWKIWEP
jgi:hypothetical protein